MGIRSRIQRIVGSPGTFLLASDDCAKARGGVFRPPGAFRLVFLIRHAYVAKRECHFLPWTSLVDAACFASSVCVCFIVQCKIIPVQAYKGPQDSGGRAPRICRQSVHEGGKVVSPTHRPTLPHKRYP